jgi:hypothetical protein
MATWAEFLRSDPTYFSGGIHNVKEELSEKIQSPKDESSFYKEDNQKVEVINN